jgi:hypothetical protein
MRRKGSGWEFKERLCTSLHSCKRGLKAPQVGVIRLLSMLMPQQDQSVEKKLTAILRTSLSVSEAEKDF